MFGHLSERLASTFSQLRGKGVVTEQDVIKAMREVRVALLEADVALPVVKDAIAQIKEKAVGEEVVRSVSPAQMVIKIVQDHLTEMLGGKEQAPWVLRGAAPSVVLLAGLQGSGKTTSCGKLGWRLQHKEGKKVLMASLDIYRPAAQKQLAVLGEQTGVATLPIVEGQRPEAIAKRALQTSRTEGYDVLLLDTAGRLSIDEALMAELQEVSRITQPADTFLVADALTGQDAVTTATHFQDALAKSGQSLSGLILTRLDGDGRGGAALSMKHVTGCPILFAGMGETYKEFEPFHPTRIAERILGMGDVASLVEKATEAVEEEEAKKLAKKLQKGRFDFDDLASQIRTIEKMGGMGGVMNLLPGMGKMKQQLADAPVDETALKKQLAMIGSMTKEERGAPDLLNASRKRRIAKGSGATVQELNRLVKQLKQMQGMMKKVKKMGVKNLMRGGMGALLPRG